MPRKAKLLNVREHLIFVQPVQGVFVRFGTKYPSAERDTVAKHLIGDRRAIIAYIREYVKDSSREVESVWRDGAKIEYWYSQKV